MNAPVDLANLHEMTGNDAEMEQLLFAEFYAAFEQGIDTLRKNSLPAEGETWRTQAHALKGIALNLGAAKLGTCCGQAQNDYAAPTDVKNALLDTIANEYEQVKKYLTDTARA